ncbi:hypothetical protein [Formosa sp. PL04]|uniref:hypothetical protein n=1 Tax=Formosa sp. PL04 TaxID=3081755 RepID=UPI0029812EA7|nr:hypothetical protein [Formosa sp. PL04]MDW5288106.1 hypothetical protein [Formosa sp. PL04]
MEQNNVGDYYALVGISVDIPSVLNSDGKEFNFNNGGDKSTFLKSKKMASESL